MCHIYNPQIVQLKTRKAFTACTGQMCSVLANMEGSSVWNTKWPQSKWEGTEEVSFTPELKLRIRTTETVSTLQHHRTNRTIILRLWHKAKKKAVQSSCCNFLYIPAQERSQKAPGRQSFELSNPLISLQRKLLSEVSKSQMERILLRINSTSLSPGYRSILQYNLLRKTIFLQIRFE